MVKAEPSRTTRGVPAKTGSLEPSMSMGRVSAGKGPLASARVMVCTPFAAMLKSMTSVPGAESALA